MFAYLLKSFYSLAFRVFLFLFLVIFYWIYMAVYAIIVIAEVPIMHLRKTKTSTGRIYLAIVDSFYDKQKKMSRSKTIESLGYLDVLEKEYDDPIAHFQQRIEQLKAEKAARQAPIHFTFYDSDRLCIGDVLRKNFGYAALSQVYHELDLHTFLTNRQRHSKNSMMPIPS